MKMFKGCKWYKPDSGSWSRVSYSAISHAGVTLFVFLLVWPAAKGSFAIDDCGSSGRRHIWEKHETAKLITEKVIYLDLDPDESDADARGVESLFGQYFYTTSCFRRDWDTILYIPGGPGTIPPKLPDLEILLDPSISALEAHPQYALQRDRTNIVYVHVRGSGRSQLPRSHEYDEFLRTDYILHDLEALRESLLGEGRGWTAVYGHSHGALIAHRYASRYGRSTVGKLILSGPPSRHADPSNLERKEVLRQMLRRLYSEQLTEQESSDIGETVNTIVRTVEQLLVQLEEKFGNDRNVLLADHCSTQANGIRELDEYTCEFYYALFKLRQVGIADRNRIEWESAARIIVDEIFGENAPRYDGENWEFLVLADRERFKKELGTDLLRKHSVRARQVLAVNDGIAANLIRKKLSVRFGTCNRFAGCTSTGTLDECRVIRESAGLRMTNSYPDKIYCDSFTSIQPWDPKTEAHKVPTLIFVGELDTISTVSQARYFFDHSLRGPRMLIVLDHYGHSMDYVLMRKVLQAFLNKAVLSVCKDYNATLDGNLSECCRPDPILGIWEDFHVACLPETATKRLDRQ